VSADTYISGVTSNSLFYRFMGLGTNDIMNVSPDLGVRHTGPLVTPSFPPHSTLIPPLTPLIPR